MIWILRWRRLFFTESHLCFLIDHISRNILILLLNIHNAGEIGMGETFLSGWTLDWIDLKHFFHEVKGLGINPLVLLLIKVKVTWPVLNQHFIVFLTRENRVSQEKIMEDYSCWKHIRNRLAFRFHIFNINDLWRHEARSSTSDE